MQSVTGSRIGASLILFFGTLFSFPSALADPIEGYLSSFSVSQGDSVELYVTTTSATYNVDIFKVGLQRPKVATYVGMSGIQQQTPENAWLAGAQWINPLVIDIPAEWSSGIYEFVLKTNDSSYRLNAVVKENVLGSKSNILVLDNSTTKAAYNAWGGKSLYTYNSSNSNRATSVSLLRPGQNRSLEEEVEFTNWAEAMGINLEHASMIDLHNDPSLLDRYDILVLLGHSEYWTKEMRDNFDDFIQSGGNALVLSGNTMWWQVRIEGSNMVCYKKPETSDPKYGVDNSIVTTNFFDSPVNDPENSSIGVSWRNGGYVNYQEYYPASEGYGGYTVTDENHEIFSGTGLENGDVFGQSSTIVGYETDGAVFNWIDGMPVVTGDDGTPLNFKILGLSPAQTPKWSGNATMGIFSNTGTVFNAATVDWADGLFTDGLWPNSSSSIADPLVSKITLNVLSMLDADSYASCSNSYSNIDSDDDGIIDACDNCVSIQNSEQLDTDIDGTGNSCDKDDDGDGLLDGDEINIHGTDPLNSDSDGDGLHDGVEIAYATNPMVADTDLDGYSDGEEVAAGSDPLDDASVPTVLPDGDANDDGQVDVADLLLVMQTLTGQHQNPTQDELDRWNVAPLVNGVPQPDQENNLGDFLILQRKVLGIINF